MTSNIEVMLLLTEILDDAIPIHEKSLVFLMPIRNVNVNIN